MLLRTGSAADGTMQFRNSRPAAEAADEII